MGGGRDTKKQNPHNINVKLIEYLNLFLNPEQRATWNNMETCYAKNEKKHASSHF